MSKESRRRQREPHQQPGQVAVVPSARRGSPLLGWIGLVGAVVALVFVAVALRPRSDKPAAVPVAPVIAQPVTAKMDGFVQPKTLAELLALPPDQLEKVDLALIDLLCAEGLRGSEDLDVNRVLGTLDAWTAHVASETRRNQHLFDEHPERFKNSLPYFRMAMVATVLTQDLRIRYNPDREKQLENGHTIKSPEDEAAFFADSKDVFIHGLLSGQHYGTCASLPFLYAAIGRRLGYPVTLATTATHFYVRYDEGDGKHLNVEATEHRAFLTPSDDEYKNPFDLNLSDDEVKGMAYLQPMDNKRILGAVLLTRSSVLKSMRKFDEQAEIWTTAARYLPDTPYWQEIIHNMRLLTKNEAEQERREKLWREVALLQVPRGPGYAYFQDKKVQLHLLINNSPDNATIAKAIDAFEWELAEHIGPIEPGDRRAPIQPIELAPSPLPMVLRRIMPSGKEVKIPADLLPPFARGLIPAELSRRVDDKKLDDEESILAEFWSFYDEQAQVAHRTAQDRQAGERQQILQNASGGSILIAREQVPPEYWNGIPQQLQLMLSGMNDERQIVAEMWAFRQSEELQLRQKQEAARNTARNQVVDVLRAHGISLPPANYGPPSVPQPSPSFGAAQNTIPEMYREWITPEIARQLTDTDMRQLRQNEQNLVQAQQSQETFRRMQSSGPPMTRIQLVPASAQGGGVPTPDSANFPLTPLPPTPQANR